MESFSLFGDSIFKGARYDSDSGKYVVNDRFGFDEIARRAGLTVRNFSKFGCTVPKALNYVKKMFTKIDSDMVLMNFGGNDSDFDWDTIAERPQDIHRPNTELDHFIDSYNRMIDFVLEKRSLPVLATLLPFHEKRYLDHICKVRNLDRKNILSWVKGRDTSLSDHQKEYSDAVCEIASARGIPLIDLRSAFTGRNSSSLIGPDGIHPSEKGQKVISDCLEAFMDDYLAV